MNARVVRVAVSTKISARVSTPCWGMGSLMGRPLPVLVDADDALGGPLSLDGNLIKAGYSLVVYDKFAPALIPESVLLVDQARRTR